jgi:thiol-disulfide isomerase/thioredoxin
VGQPAITDDVTDARPPPRQLARVIRTLAIVVIAGGAGFCAYRLTANRPSAFTAAPSGPLPSAAPPPQAAPTPRQTPEVVPEIALTDSAGVRRKLSEWQGRPTLINFWATWCEPCRREIPLLQKLRTEHSAEGVEVIGIAVDFRDAVLKYAREMHIDYPVLIGEQDGLDAVAALGMDSVFPFTVFADSRARIVTLKVGELHADEADFILSRVREVDAGRLALPEARQQVAARIRELAAQRARAAAGPVATPEDPRKSAQEVP